MNYTEKLLEVCDLHKVYTKDGVPTKALNGISFNVLNGEYLGIMGASGSGKTTLLNCIATVIKPTSGQILLSGANISSFDGTKLAEYRGNKIGYLFQDFALLDNLTGKENIILPLSIHNIDIVTAEKKLKDIADLDVNKDSIENCYMLNPDLVDVNDRQRILQSFNSVKARKIMKVEDELKDEDRIAFEHTVLQSFGIDDYFDKIKSSLLSMQATRKTVKEL